VFNAAKRFGGLEMTKSGDGHGSSTHYWEQGGTSGGRERIEVVDRERDARVGWTKGGRLKIGKMAKVEPIKETED
jgi:hypothetical protein